MSDEHVPPTEEELKEWEALERQGTPRPWATGRHCQLEAEALKPELKRFPEDIDLMECVEGQWGEFKREEDAELASVARNALPRLIAEVRRLRIDLGHCEAIINETCDEAEAQVKQHTENCTAIATKAIADARAEQREADAKLVEKLADFTTTDIGAETCRNIADAIRRGGGG